MMRYLQPDELKRRGLDSFDAWANTYGEKVVGIEQTASGTFRPVVRFSKFVNLPELGNLFQNVADIRVASEVPEMKAAQPRLLDNNGENKRITVVAPAHPALERYMEDIVKRVDDLKNVDPREDNMLKISSDARKASLDVRMVWPSAPYNPNGKIPMAARNIAKIYHDEAEAKGTQLVFLDLGTPKASEGKDRDDDATTDGQDELTGDEQKVLRNVYGTLRRELVSIGVPEDQVAFIHEHNTPNAREHLFAQVRSGEVRVLVGSTEKIGVGVNVQDRAAAAHHIDVPWRPRDVEQREGRIIRQGNKAYGPVIDEETGDVLAPGRGVKIFQYVQEQSFDGFMWQAVESKARAIKALMKREQSERGMSDVDPFVMGAAEAKALATGDPLALRAIELEVKATVGRASRDAHHRQVRDAKRQTARYEVQIDAYQKELPALDADARHVAALPVGADFAATIGGQTYDKRPEAGRALAADLQEVEYQHRGNQQTQPLGSYKGFDVGGLNTDRGYQLVISHPETQHPHQTASLDLSDVTPTGLMSRLDNLVRNIPARAKRAGDNLATAEDSVRLYAEQIAQPFRGGEELDHHERQLRVVKSRLADDPKLLQEGDDFDMDLEGDFDAGPREAPDVDDVTLRSAVESTRSPEAADTPAEVSDALEDVLESPDTATTSAPDKVVEKPAAPATSKPDRAVGAADVAQIAAPERVAKEAKTAVPARQRRWSDDSAIDPEYLLALEDDLKALAATAGYRINMAGELAYGRIPRSKKSKPLSSENIHEGLDEALAGDNLGRDRTKALVNELERRIDGAKTEIERDPEVKKAYGLARLEKDYAWLLSSAPESQHERLRAGHERERKDLLAEHAPATSKPDRAAGVASVAQVDPPTETPPESNKTAMARGYRRQKAELERAAAESETAQKREPEAAATVETPAAEPSTSEMSVEDRRRKAVKDYGFDSEEHLKAELPKMASRYVRGEASEDDKRVVEGMSAERARDIAAPPSAPQPAPEPEPSIKAAVLADPLAARMHEEGRLQVVSVPPRQKERPEPAPQPEPVPTPAELDALTAEFDYPPYERLPSGVRLHFLSLYQKRATDKATAEQVSAERKAVPQPKPTASELIDQAKHGPVPLTGPGSIMEGLIEEEEARREEARGKREQSPAPASAPEPSLEDIEVWMADLAAKQKSRLSDIAFNEEEQERREALNERERTAYRRYLEGGDKEAWEAVEREVSSGLVGLYQEVRDRGRLRVDEQTARVRAVNLEKRKAENEALVESGAADLVRDKLKNARAYQNALSNSDAQNTKIEYDIAMERAVVDLLAEGHIDLFKRFSDDPDFRERLDKHLETRAPREAGDTPAPPEPEPEPTATIEPLD